jgi:HK97 family phage portal protein
MRLLGYDIQVAKAAPPWPLLPPITNNGWFDGWFNVIRESFPGAWQRNVEVRLDNVLTFSTVYACISLVASDIGKLCIDLVMEDEETDIWTEVDSPAFSPVLRKPNRYQTRQKFIEQWVASKLIHGNTYVLKEYDNRKVVVAMYVLDPQRCRPLIAPDGAVYYQLGANLLAGIDDANAAGIDQTEVTRGSANFVVPASYVIHDVMVPLYHPLIGVTPITACGLSAVQGIAMQQNSATFFQNMSRPGGILTAPGPISDEKARMLRDRWEQNFGAGSNNQGKTAVLGDGLTYQAMTISPVDADMINQLKMSSEQVCSAFHVPPYMVGVAPAPSLNNVEAINQQYYSQCLQCLMEAIEALLDDGLGLEAAGYGSQFDLDDLLKMDTATQYRTYCDGIKAGLVAPNEARKKINLPPLTGGDTVYLQQQNFSIEALNERDQNKPFAKPVPALPAPASKPANNNAPPAPQDQAAMLHEIEWLAGLKQAVNHARTQ